MYGIFRFLHISAAIIWVGGGILGVFFTRRAMSADPAHRLGISRDMGFASARVFAPSAMATLVFGILMVLDADAVEFEQAWITIGIAIVVVSTIIGMAYLGPRSKALVADLEAGDERAASRLKAIYRVMLLDLVILLAAVWVMVDKPGLG